MSFLYQYMYVLRLCIKSIFSQSLQWQISQKNKEVVAIQQKMELTEQRHQGEIDDLKRTIEDNQAELEGLREELGTALREKAEQQAQVTELRTTLKASVQHHKVTVIESKPLYNIIR